MLNCEVLRAWIGSWLNPDGNVGLTHVLTTMPHFANDRVAHGLEMPGVIAVGRNLPYSSVIRDLLPMEHCMEPAELAGKNTYLPLR
jgi:hypothetical protein